MSKERYNEEGLINATGSLKKTQDEKESTGKKNGEDTEQYEEVERETETERERQRERETETERDRDRERHRDREKDRQTKYHMQNVILID